MTADLLFRLSDDGIAWTPWRDLISIKRQIPEHGYAQVRVWTGRDWYLSPVLTDLVEE